MWWEIINQGMDSAGFKPMLLFCLVEKFYFSPHELLHDFLHPHLHTDKADPITPPQAEQVQQVPVGLFQYELLPIKHSHLSCHTLSIF